MSGTTGILDDVKRKLAINNPIMQNQAFVKLLSCIRGKIFSGSCEGYSIISEKISNFPELEFVWEKCIDPNPMISNGMCRILITLVLMEQADADYVLRGLLSHVPHTRNGGSIIKAIYDILMMDKSQQRFNIRNPVHPFVIVLQCQASFWSHVLEQLTKGFSTDLLRSKTQVFVTMKPLLQYILSDPRQPEDCFSLRTSLFMMLISKCEPVECNDLLLKFLLQSVNFMQLGTDGCCVEAASRLQKVSGLFLSASKESDFTRISKDHLLLCSLALCIHLNRLNLDISSCLSSVESLASALCKTGNANNRRPSILLLACLLMEVTPHHQLHIIRICNILIDNEVAQCHHFISGFLFLPLITILSTPLLERQIAFDATYANVPCNLQQHAAKLLQRLESASDQSDYSYSRPPDDFSVIRSQVANFSSHLAEAYELSDLALRLQFLYSHATVVQWLRHVQQMSAKGIEVHFPLLCALCSTAIRCNDSTVIKECVDVIATLAERCVHHAPSLFAVLLYMLKEHEGDQPTVRLHILKTLPRFAVHKNCIAPIIRIISTLGTVPGLKAVSVRLMCSLWLQSDRVFSQLNKLLVDMPHDCSLVSMFDEMTLAKAASILQVCETKPDQHGADLLTVLSKMINLNGPNALGSAITSLCIDSLHVLCEHQVIDLRTTWLYLKRVLGNDERPLVVKKLCDLLSLAERLKVDSDDGENFVSDVVETLWSYVVKSDDALIVAGAYEALSNFDNKRHQLKYLPQDITCRTVQSFHDDDDDDGGDVASCLEQQLQCVPGSCFMDLLLSIRSHQVLMPSFQIFFARLVNREVEEMRRDVLHKSKLICDRNLKPKSKKSPLIEKARKLFSEISLTGSSAVLKNSLALGFLFAWEPHDVPLGKNVTSANQKYLMCGKSYNKMLEILLSQTEVDISDWRRTMLYVSAWCNFMEKAYLATVQARLAQLDLHHNQDDQNFEAIRDTVWLWARDNLANSLKEASRGRVSAHGNAIIGLAGLAAVIVKHNNLSTRSSGVLDSPKVPHNKQAADSEHLDHNHWLHEIIRALIKVLSQSDEPAGGPFSWCYSVCGQNNPYQAFTALAFVALAEALVAYDKDAIEAILNVFADRLNEPRTMPLTRFCVGLGLGLLLSGLILHGILDAGVVKSKQLVLRFATQLKSYCFKSDLDSRTGGILGLAILTCTMAKHEDVEICDFSHVTATMFISRLSEMKLMPINIEVLCYGASLIVSAMCVVDQRNMQQVNELFAILLELSATTKDIMGAAALGVLTATLENLAIETYGGRLETLLQKFLDTLSDEKAPSSCKLSALYGAHASLPGSFEQDLINGYDVDGFQMKGKTADLMEEICKLAAFSDDVSLKGKCLSILGEFIWITEQLEEKSNQICCDVSYLNDNSVLKYIIKTVQNFNAMEKKVEHHSHLLVCLRALAQKTNRPFPAVNWGALLKPILHYSTETQECCVEIAVARSPCSPSAATFVKSLLIGSASRQLKESSRLQLYCAIPIIIRYTSAETLHSFLEESSRLIFERTPTSLSTGEVFIKGIMEALKAPDPPASVVQVLYLTLAHIFQFVDPQIKSIWQVYCEAAQELPEEIVHQISNPSKDNCLKTLAFGGSLMALNGLSLQCLNRHLDIAIICIKKPQDQEALMETLLDCFGFSDSNTSQISECQLSARIVWILELMDHFQNVMQQHKFQAVEEHNTLQQVSLNLFTVFGTAIISLSSSPFRCYLLKPLGGGSVKDMLLHILPTALKHLVLAEAWRPHVTKIAEWLIAISKKPFVHDVIKWSTKSCLLSLRDYEDFKKVSIWTRAVEMITE